jgi:hypothetical protein
MRARGAALALLAAAACSAEGFAPDPPGVWLQGDLHVHATGASNDTGGDSTPEAIKAVAMARGLDFVVLTDHSNSTGSDPSTRDEDPALFNRGPEFVYFEAAARLSEPGRFLMISGNELSPVADPPNEPRGHVGCLPRALEGFDTDSPFTDRPMSAVSGREAVAQAKARGCFAVVNHPYAQVAWIRYDWGSLDYDGMEVFNGGLAFDAGDLEAYEAWRCDLLAGRRVTPIAASDNHRVHIEAPGLFLDSALGYPSTSVFASDATWPAIVAALDAGHVMLHEGGSRLTLDAYDEARRPAAPAEARWLRVRGALDAGATGAVLALRHATGCRDPRPAADAGPEVTEDNLLLIRVAPGDAFEHAVAVSGAPGVYTATLITEDGRYTALSRALVVE